MIVQRMTFVAKPGCRDKMLEILQDLWKTGDRPPTHRIYVSISGPLNAIQQEIEFEDFEAREKFWADAMSAPGVEPLLKKLIELEDTGATSEFLRLVE